MAQKYLEQLTGFMKEAGVSKVTGLECKHFFSGAACYIDGKIFASLTPVGFALKLPEKTRSKLIKEGGKTLRYFPKAPVKKEYVVLTKRMVNNIETFKNLVEIGMKYAQTRKT